MRKYVDIVDVSLWYLGLPYISYLRTGGLLAHACMINGRGGTGTVTLASINILSPLRRVWGGGGEL